MPLSGSYTKVAYRIPKVASERWFLLSQINGRFVIRIWDKKNGR